MGFLVFLLYTMRRVDCPRGGVVEEVPWGKRTLTNAYMLFLACWARRLSKEVRKASAASFHDVVTVGLAGENEPRH